MNQKQIDNFFQVFSQNLKGRLVGKIKIILTGAAAGTLLGGVRPSIDIDFAVTCGNNYLEESGNAIKEASEITGIAVNFSEDIDRWSQITFLDYKKHVIPYKTFGRVEVVILSPPYWSIGKITRYLDPDIDDLVRVLKNNPVPCLKLAALWGKALLKSPRSSASYTFRSHVEHFLKTYGRIIWGKDYNLNQCLRVFWNTCGIKDSKVEG